MSKKVYVVTAYRFGDRERHSYIVGIYDTEATAILASEDEENFRGGKYLCEILQSKVYKLVPTRDKIMFKLVKPLS